MERSTSRNLWIGLGLIALLVLVATSWGGGMLFGRGIVAPLGPFGYHAFVGPWLFGAWGLGLLLRLLFFGLVFWLIFRAFRGGRGYQLGYYDGAHDSPSEILSRRYAAGEISREQYEEMRRTLEPVV
jgi:putative membrane protein